MGVQLWHRPAGHGHVHRAPDRDQPILRYRYQEMSPRHESRRSHIAEYGLQDQRPAADDGRRGRPIRKSLAHEQLEDRCQSRDESRRERRTSPGAGQPPRSADNTTPVLRYERPEAQVLTVAQSSAASRSKLKATGTARECTRVDTAKWKLSRFLA